MSSSFNSSKRGSGVVVPIEEVQKVFSKFDENGDGLISGDELKNAFRDIGWEMKPEEVKTAMSEFDKDGDGHIDLEEFTALLDGSPSTKVLHDAFDLYDLDKNGLISTDELHEVLNRLGHNCSVAECATMISNVDVDGDGFVNFQEFKKMINRS
ncbi:probable calcium-binding protein CML27 [Argentina anserina]|uniref:probable calcium-binding protein CML27 n=1 Tax=Argentina anserina TaxID=57926 RepID=UPI00217689A6|nr:probable calcium-binding protein CML27 [Potentilla anserina]